MAWRPTRRVGSRNSRGGSGRPNGPGARTPSLLSIKGLCCALNELGEQDCPLARRSRHCWDGLRDIQVHVQARPLSLARCHWRDPPTPFEAQPNSPPAAVGQNIKLNPLPLASRLDRSEILALHRAALGLSNGLQVEENWLSWDGCADVARPGRLGDESDGALCMPFDELARPNTGNFHTRFDFYALHFPHEDDVAESYKLVEAYGRYLRMNDGTKKHQAERKVCSFHPCCSHDRIIASNTLPSSLRPSLPHCHGFRRLL